MHRGKSPSNAESWMNERRLELGASWEEMAESAGVVTNTLRRARRGQPVQDLQARAIEKAFGWEPGSLTAIARGDAPTLVSEQDDQQEQRRTLPPLPVELRDDAEVRFWEGMAAIDSVESKSLLLQLYRRERKWGNQGTGA